MQQKYCAQGRSTELFTTTWPILLARISCATGGKQRTASIFPSAKSCSRSADGLEIYAMSLAGSSPT
jgi:hypothetical protein